MQVVPGKSFLSYLGGKSRLAKTIIPKIPEHTCYCEVFAGAAWLLFKKEESEVEIINDINKELVTLYRVLKHHLEEFIRHFKWCLTARDEFERLKLEEPETLTDIQGPPAFITSSRTDTPAGLSTCPFRSIPPEKPISTYCGLKKNYRPQHLRLSRVYIENLPYNKLISRFDKPHTFFYIDPPYYGCEDDYSKNIFHREDFEKLRDILLTIQGKFIMSINNAKEIRELFKMFTIEEVSTSYTVAGAHKQKKVTELLIRNF